MLGQQTQVTVGSQSAVATPNTTQRTNLNIYKIDGGGSESMPDDLILSGGLYDGSDPTAPAPGLNDHTLSVDVPLCLNQFPIWMTAGLGPSVDAGATGAYTHTFNSGIAVAPMNTVEHMRQTGDYRQHLACVMSSMAIDLSADREGFAMATLGFMGYDELPSTSVLAGTVLPTPTLLRPPQKLLNTTYNGVSAAGQIMGGKFTFDRKLKRHRKADGTGQPYEISYDDRSEFSGSFHVRYKDPTLDTDAIARTVRAASMVLATGSGTSIAFNMANIRLERTPVPIAGPAGVEYDINFKGWQTAAAPALTVVVTNANQNVTY